MRKTHQHNASRRYQRSATVDCFFMRMLLCWCLLLLLLLPVACGLLLLFVLCLLMHTGPEGAYEEEKYPYLTQEKEYIRHVHQQKIPFLGKQTHTHTHTR